MLTNISGKTGSLTRILEDLLPSCAVVTDVTPAAVAGLNTVAIPLLDTQTRLNDRREGIPFDTLRPKMSPKDVRRPVQTFISNNPAAIAAAKLFAREYDAVAAEFAVDVIAQLRQGVQLSQSSATTRESKAF